MPRMRIDCTLDGKCYTEVEIEVGPCVQIKTEKGMVLIDRSNWFLLVQFVDQHMMPAKKTA